MVTSGCTRLGVPGSPVQNPVAETAPRESYVIAALQRRVKETGCRGGVDRACAAGRR